MYEVSCYLKKKKIQLYMLKNALTTLNFSLITVKQQGHKERYVVMTVRENILVPQNLRGCF